MNLCNFAIFFFLLPFAVSSDYYEPARARPRSRMSIRGHHRLPRPGAVSKPRGRRRPSPFPRQAAMSRRMPYQTGRAFPPIQKFKSARKPPLYSYVPFGASRRMRPFPAVREESLSPPPPPPSPYYSDQGLVPPGQVRFSQPNYERQVEPEHEPIIAGPVLMTADEDDVSYYTDPEPSYAGSQVDYMQPTRRQFYQPQSQYLPSVQSQNHLLDPVHQQYVTDYSAPIQRTRYQQQDPQQLQQHSRQYQSQSYIKPQPSVQPTSQMTKPTQLDIQKAVQAALREYGKKQHQKSTTTTTTTPQPLRGDIDWLKLIDESLNKQPDSTVPVAPIIGYQPTINQVIPEYGHPFDDSTEPELVEGLLLADSKRLVKCDGNKFISTQQKLPNIRCCSGKAFNTVKLACLDGVIVEANEWQRAAKTMSRGTTPKTEYQHHKISQEVPPEIEITNKVKSTKQQLLEFLVGDGSSDEQMAALLNSLLGSNTSHDLLDSMTIPEPTTTKMPEVKADGLKILPNGTFTLRCQSQSWMTRDPPNYFKCCRDILVSAKHPYCKNGGQPESPLLVHYDDSIPTRKLPRGVALALNESNQSSLTESSFMPENVDSMILDDTMIKNGTIVATRARSANRRSKSVVKPPENEQDKGNCPVHDSSKFFCCGKLIYRKQLGQVCCDGNYGVAELGDNHSMACCGPIPFNTGTYACSESSYVVLRR